MLTSAWQNPHTRLDVDFNGLVAPNDVLAIFNRINAEGSGPLPPTGSGPPYYDTNGDMLLAPVDALLPINALNGDASPPIINAGLLRDTAPAGETNEDFLTFNPTIFAVVQDATGTQSLQIQVDDGPFISLDIEPTQEFTYAPALATDGTDDGSHTVRIKARDGRGNEESVEFTFVLDTIGPQDLSWELAAESDTAPQGDGITEEPSIVIEGESESLTIAQVLPEGLFSTADEQGRFRVHGVPLQLGTNDLEVVSFDLAGNSRSTSGTLSRTAAAGDLFLSEGGGFAVEASRIVTLGDAAGRQIISFEIEARFDVSDQTGALEDQLLVYLVDSGDRSRTLLDRGERGTSLFALSGDEAEFPAGIVQFDGQRVQLDVTSIEGATDGRLVFQLIDRDQDAGSQVVVRDLRSEPDTVGGETVHFPQVVEPALAPGGPLATDGMTEATELSVNTRNARFEPTSGLYRAEVSLTNKGEPTSRTLALVFEDLPQDVVLQNASGVTGSGEPYLNLTPAVDSGGLLSLASSDWIELEFANPPNVAFAMIPTVLQGVANRPPAFETIAPQTIRPGQTLELPLMATDEDGDQLAFTAMGSTGLNVTLVGNALSIEPSPADVGTHNLQVFVDDGAIEVEQTITIDVVADPVTTTRISGVVLDTHEDPLPGIPVELGETSTTTLADGSFLLDFGENPPMADTLKIRGELYSGQEVYPFIAEKLHLLFGRDLYAGVNNELSRPIYLPALDVANAQTIDPSSDATVSVQLSTGESPVEVFVAAGSLETQEGTPFEGRLSITEVPRMRTPAALPSNLFPDVVVTIQPGEMVFTQPAPISFPNRSLFSPGEMMDLWSINPVTGEFEVVGEMRVSNDGGTIETISGGIRNSSWHMPAPQDRLPRDETKDPRCDLCAYTKSGFSEVEMFSGALLETHRLPSYTSLGEARGVVLRYDSDRADPRSTFRFSYDVVLQQPVESPPDSFTRMVARATIDTGDVTLTSSGLERGAFGLPGGENLWDPGELPPGKRVGAALQMELGRVPTGVYPYELTSGFMRLSSQGDSVGTLNSQTGYVVTVNAMDSPFGSGWGIAGWQQIVEHPQFQDAVLLVDGDGSEQMFIAPFGPGLPYLAPPGEFSRLEKIDGRFRRTTPDRMVYQFNADNKLQTVTDRNGNETRYVYGAGGELQAIVDPVGLETRFDYADGRVHTITDPAGRVTTLRFDARGTLMGIVNPDGSENGWSYDGSRRLTGKVDRRGGRESITYGMDGAVRSGIRADGSQLQVLPAQSRGLFSTSRTIDLENAPAADTDFSHDAYFVDARGHTERLTLDRGGQLVSSADGIGHAVTILRSSQNLVTGVINGRGDLTRFSYDDRGNVVGEADAISASGSVPRDLFPGRVYEVGSDSSFNPNPVSLEIGDFNQDQYDDIVTANIGDSTISILYGNGDGVFGDRVDIGVGRGPRSVDVGDVNGDGRLDVVVTNLFENTFEVLSNLGGGVFAPPVAVPAGDAPYAIRLADLNDDDLLDAVVAKVDDDSVSVYIGDGQGSFGGRTDISVGDGPSALRISDVNGDERPDVITGNFDDDTVTVLINQGNAVFGQRQDYAVGGFTPFAQADALAVGDINGDGLPDIATPDRQADTVTILTNVGDGTFLPASQVIVGTDLEALALTDIDQDNAGDLIAYRRSGEVSLLWGDGAGGLSAPIEYNGVLAPTGVRVRDVNRDGNPDVIATSYTDVVSVLFGRSNGGLSPAYDAYETDRNANTVKSADLNGDGVLDLVTANAIDVLGRNRVDDTISVLLGSGDGTFLPRRDLVVGDGPRDLVLAHFDADGTIDVLTANNEQQALSFLPGSGDGTFGEPRITQLGRDVQALATADLNHDEILDAVTVNWPGDSVSILLGNGDGTFTAPTHRSVGSRPLDVALGDVTEDGEVDVIVAVNGAGVVTVFPGFGDGTFDAPFNLSPVSRPSAVEVADLDGDDRNDLLVANDSHPSSVTVYMGQPGVGLVLDDAYPVGRSPQDVIAVDMNGDQLLDIVSVGSNDTASVLLADVGGGFGQREDYMMDDDVSAVTSGDFNLDGMDDLAVATTISVSVLQNQFGEPASRGNTVGEPIQRSFDPTFNQLASYTDELGRQTVYEIDPTNGNRRATTRPGNLLSSYTYSGAGQVETETDALGRVTEFTYDSAGRLDRITFAKGTTDEGTQQFEYDSAGNQTAFIDENNNRTTFEYDDHNRLTLVRDALGHTTRYEYDAAGNVIRVRDAKGNVTRHEYDEEHRLIRTIDSGYNVTRFVYDSAGNLTRIVDPLGNATRNAYDARDRVFNTTDPEGGATEFRYDLDNNLVSLTDPVGNTTRFRYDARDRLIRETDPLGKSTAYQYDAVDNLIRKTDRNRRVTEFVYDDLDRLDFETWLNSDGSRANRIDYGYDPVGNLRSVTDAFSALAFTYDARDRVETTDNAGTPSAPQVLLTYAYDAAGNVTSVVDTIEGEPGAATNYEYDALNRQREIRQTAADGATGAFPVQDKSVEFGYNAIGQFETIDRYSDLDGMQLIVGTTYAYDDLNRLERLAHANSIAAIAFYDYMYDSASRISQITDIGGVTDYTYDERSQLTGADRVSDDERGDEAYEYDANGNRVHSHLHGDAYVTREANRLQSDGTYTYQYDDEGNLIGRTEVGTGATRDLRYDHRNRLTAVVDRSASGSESQRVEFTYDALDRRVAKAVQDASGEVVIYFVYDREDVLFDFRDDDGNGPSEPVLDKRYLHGPQTDQILAREDASGEVLWHLTDHLGTVRDLADFAAEVANHIQYDSFGTVISQSDASKASRYQFTGREIDVATGLYYYRARYYDSQMGTFLAEDPIGFIAGSRNLRSYVSNSPVSRIDPFGLQDWDVFIEATHRALQQVAANDGDWQRAWRELQTERNSNFSQSQDLTLAGAEQAAFAGYGAQQLYHRLLNLGLPKDYASMYAFLGMLGVSTSYDGIKAGACMLPEFMEKQILRDMGRLSSGPAYGAYRDGTPYPSTPFNAGTSGAKFAGAALGTPHLLPSAANVLSDLGAAMLNTLPRLLGTP